MVKAVILDVDGVIVGKETGFNFPLPNIEVINYFKSLKTKGIPIVLCTAKFNFAINKIIESTHLDNPHIADGGALIYDPLNNKIIKEHLIEKSVIKSIVNIANANNIFLELYTTQDYFIQKGQDENILKKRIPVLQKPPVITNSLLKIADSKDIIKLIILYMEQDKSKIAEFLKPFEKTTHILWSYHPALAPITPCVITAPNVSKKHAAIETFESLNIPFENILGIGDTLGDWNFMELCKFVACPGNATDELKALVRSKGEQFSYIGPSVDENGIIDIINHFLLIGSPPPRG